MPEPRSRIDDARGAHEYAAAARAHRPEWTEGLAGLQRALKPDFPDFPMCFADFGMALGNLAGSVRWTHIFGDDLFTSALLSASNYKTGFTGGFSGT